MLTRQHKTNFLTVNPRIYLLPYNWFSDHISGVIPPKNENFEYTYPLNIMIQQIKLNYSRKNWYDIFIHS